MEGLEKDYLQGLKHMYDHHHSSRNRGAWSVARKQCARAGRWWGSMALLTSGGAQLHEGLDVQRRVGSWGMGASRASLIRNRTVGHGRILSQSNIRIYIISLIIEPWGMDAWQDSSGRGRQGRIGGCGERVMLAHPAPTGPRCAGGTAMQRLGDFRPPDPVCTHADTQHASSRSCHHCDH